MKEDIDSKIHQAISLKKNLENKLEKLIPDIKEINTRHFKLRMSLIKESDRGAALISVSYLESHLEDALKATLIGTSAHLKKCFDFNGPLGTFSSKIDIALSVGIINTELHKEITTFRKIRNVFAHEYDEINFDTDKISNYISLLKFSPRDDHETCTKRQYFLSSLFYILGYLQGYAKFSEKITVQESLKNFEKTLNEIRKTKIYTK